jgi:DNA-binding HxlR family transcriptional regulator
MSTPVLRSTSEEIDNAISMIAEAHVLCIINHLSEREMRFNEIQRSIKGLNPTTLSDRLKRLEKDGLVERKEETLDKVSVVYSLTEKGKALTPVINEIARFAEKFPAN